MIPVRRLAFAALFGILVAQPLAADAPLPQPGGPALWKVADEDTTIYLFGTVHALPRDIEWYRGPIAAALGAAQVLVTEIPPGQTRKPEVRQAFLTRAMLPEGQTLRALLSDEQRAKFEAALTRLGMPVSALDRVEPWFAAITLGTLPMMKAGFSADAGVEQAVEAKAASGTKRDALETVEGQLKLFDEMPMEVQTAYLASVVEQIDRIVPSITAMVAAWARGDAEGLARLMNEDLDDPALAERLLYARNRNWAQWVAKRLDEPGTVFVAVGAGHLAGAKSVQDYLARGGVTVTRVQ